jgi:signal transduction histidine kinase
LGSLMTSVEMIHEGAQRVQCIVRELLQLAKPDDPLEPVDVRQVVGLSLELTRTTYEHRAQVHTELEQVPRVIANRGRLVQVFTNLLTNAAESITDGAQQDNIITVAVRRRESKTVQVEFRDTGCGIAREDVSRVFEPFFTTKERGTGLGLAICQRIVTSFNGEIRLEQGNPRGSIFQVLLPVADCTPLHDGVQR